MACFSLETLDTCNLGSILKIQHFDLHKTLDACSLLFSEGSAMPVLFTTTSRQRLSLEMTHSVKDVLTEVLSPLLHSVTSETYIASTLKAMHIRLAVRRGSTGRPELVIRCFWLLAEPCSDMALVRKSLLRGNISQLWKWRQGDNQSYQVARCALPIEKVNIFPYTAMAVPEIQLNLKDPLKRWLIKTKLASLGAILNTEVNHSATSLIDSQLMTDAPFTTGHLINPCWTSRQLIAAICFDNIIQSKSKTNDSENGNPILIGTSAENASGNEKITMTTNSTKYLDRVAINQLSKDIGENSLPIIFNAFATELDDQIAQLRLPPTADNYEIIARTVHTLKSSAGTLGATALNENACTLDASLKGGPSSLNAFELDKIATVASLTLTEVKHFLTTLNTTQGSNNVE